MQFCILLMDIDKIQSLCYNHLMLILTFKSAREVANGRLLSKKLPSVRGGKVAKTHNHQEIGTILNKGGQMRWVTRF